MTLSRRLTLYFLATGAAILVCSFVALIPLTRGLSSIGEFHGPALTALQTLESSTNYAIQESFAYVVAGHAAEKKEFYAWATDFERQAQEFRSLAHLDDPEEKVERSLFVSVETHSQAVISGAERMFEEYEKTGSVSSDVFDSYKNTVNALADSLDELVEIERQEVASAQEEAVGLIRTSEFLLVILGALGLVLAAVMAHFASKRITDPVEQLTAAAAELGAGNLDRRAPVDSADEMGLLARTLNQMAAELQQSLDRQVRQERLAVLGQITSTVSHELRNPLAAIRTSMAAIKRLTPEGDGRIAEVVAIGDRSIMRCDAIIGELLDYVRSSPPDFGPHQWDDWVGRELADFDLDPSITLRRDLDSGCTPQFDENESHGRSTTCSRMLVMRCWHTRPVIAN